jgi:hypothetical protein
MEIHKILSNNKYSVENQNLNSTYHNNPENRWFKEFSLSSYINFDIMDKLVQSLKLTKSLIYFYIVWLKLRNS